MNELHGLEQLERIECYLFSLTYPGQIFAYDDGHDYDKQRVFWQAVGIIRSAHKQVREVIANRIGAVLA